MSKKIHITESQLKNIIGEMAYPSSFSFDEFKKLKKFSERVRYCGQHLNKISSGSARIVYNIDGDKVLKLAKNSKGLTQNLTEIRLGTEPYYKCFANIYDYDKNGMWVEMEHCRKALKSDFKKLYGVPFEALCCFITDINNERYNFYRDYRGIVKNIMNGKETETQKLFCDVHDYISCEGLTAIGDLCRINSWGIPRNTNRYVIIDFGLDDLVFNNYYRRK